MSKILSLSSLFLMSVMGLIGCNNVTPSNNSTNNSAVNKVSATISAQTKSSPAVQIVIGNYVSEGYSKRQQGYDWVAVMVRADDNNKDGINISVRARSDIKKPTCTFDGSATLMGQDHAHGFVFHSTINDSRAFFQFKDDKLIIDSQDKYAFNRFCSGGGSIVGEYQKLEGSLELN